MNGKKEAVTAYKLPSFWRRGAAKRRGGPQWRQPPCRHSRSEPIESGALRGHLKEASRSLNTTPALCATPPSKGGEFIPTDGFPIHSHVLSPRKAQRASIEFIFWF